MAVPGAVLPVAGVTMVAVLPTHRRRGILRSMMHRQLADIAARAQEPIAALWAAETPLYGRYGYGRASSHAFFRFRRGEGALSPSAPADPALTLRLAEPAEVAGDLAKVYATVAARVLRARRRLVGAGARRPRGGPARGQPAALPAHSQ